MATTEPVDKKPRVASLDDDIQDVRPQTMARLGLLNGVLIGLAVAVGLWGVQAIALQPLPLVQKYHSILLAGGLVVAVCGLAGWLSGRLRQTAVSVLLWFIAAFGVTLIASYQPFQIRTLTAWLADRRFWGINLYPFASSFNWVVFWGMLLAGLFLILTFVFLGLFQDGRLAGVNQERGGNGRLTVRAWSKLLLPLPLVMLMSYLTSTIIADNSWRGIPIVDQTIQVVREYDGDLFELGLSQGVNYAAARGVRDAFTGPYTLSVGAIDADSLTTIIVADFENGAWIHCRFLNDQLNFCFDGSLPYTVGFHSLLTGESLPEDCYGCVVTASEEWITWLQARRDQLSDDPKITRTGMQGDHVLMRAEAADGRFAVECMFSGSAPVQLLTCREIN